jgi:uncharacterized membrane protein
MNPTFSIRTVLNSSWQLFKQRPLFFIGLQIIPAFVIWVLSFSASFILSPFENALANNPESLFISIMVVIVSLVYQLLNWFVTMSVNAGLTYTHIKAVEGKRPTFYTLAEPKKTFLPYALSLMIIGLVSLFAYLFFIIPGIIWTIITLFAGYVIVDQQAGVIDSIQKSIQLTKGVRLKLLGFLIVLAGLNILGLLLLFFGLLITIPVTTIAFAKVYTELRDQHLQLV